MPTLRQMLESLKVAAKEPKSLADVLGDFYADDVHVGHKPPMATDGPKKGPDVALLHRKETEIWLEKIPDYHHEDVKAWSEGDEIHMAIMLCGTIRGKKFRSPTHFRMVVKDGAIRHAELEGDIEASKEMMDFVMAAQMPVEVIWDPFGKAKKKA